MQYPLVVLESNTSALKSDKECSGPEEQLNEVDVMGIHKKAIRGIPCDPCLLIKNSIIFI